MSQRLIAAVAVFCSACGGGGSVSPPPPPPPPPPNTVTVQVVNTAFQPSTFNLKAGGTVTFTWGPGSTGHSVAPVAPNTIPASSNPAPPGVHSAPYSFDTTFPSPGTFKFFCNAHGAPDTGMHGTITVVP